MTRQVLPLHHSASVVWADGDAGANLAPTVTQRPLPVRQERSLSAPVSPRLAFGVSVTCQFLPYQASVSGLDPRDPAAMQPDLTAQETPFSTPPVTLPPNTRSQRPFRQSSASGYWRVHCDPPTAMQSRAVSQETSYSTLSGDRTLTECSNCQDFPFQRSASVQPRPFASRYSPTAMHAPPSQLIPFSSVA